MDTFTFMIPFLPLRICHFLFITVYPICWRHMYTHTHHTQAHTIHTPVWNSKQYAVCTNCKEEIWNNIDLYFWVISKRTRYLWSIVLEINLIGLWNCSIYLRLKKTVLNCWYCWVWDVYIPRFNPWNTLSSPVYFHRGFFFTLDLNVQYDRWTYIL
jgi:hypothetical protein